MIILEWQDKQYKVKPTETLRLISEVEDIITIGELTSGKPKLARLSIAYGTALRYAGATVKDEEIYNSFYTSDSAGMAVAATQGLLMLMISPEALQEKAAKKPKAKAKPKAKKK